MLLPVPDYSYFIHFSGGENIKYDIKGQNLLSQFRMISKVWTVSYYSTNKLPTSPNWFNSLCGSITYVVQWPLPDTNYLFFSLFHWIKLRNFTQIAKILQRIIPMYSTSDRKLNCNYFYHFQGENLTKSIRNIFIFMILLWAYYLC